MKRDRRDNMSIGTPWYRENADFMEQQSLSELHNIGIKKRFESLKREQNDMIARHQAERRQLNTSYRILQAECEHNKTVGFAGHIECEFCGLTIEEGP